MIQISVVIPCKNEAENIVSLVEGIDRALTGGPAFRTVPSENRISGTSVNGCT